MWTPGTGDETVEMIVSGRRDVTLLTRLPELPWAIQLFFYIFQLQNLANSLYEKENVG